MQICTTSSTCDHAYSNPNVTRSDSLIDMLSRPDAIVVRQSFVRPSLGRVTIAHRVFHIRLIAIVHVRHCQEQAMVLYTKPH
nr:hypothetical protein CFP56_62875 [Quercus suber]